MLSNNDLKILIIEPDPENAKDLKGRFEEAGFSYIVVLPPSGTLYDLHQIAPELAVLGPSLDLATTLKWMHRLKLVAGSTTILASRGEFRDSPESVAPFERIHYVNGFDQNTLTKIVAEAQESAIPLGGGLPITIGQSSSVLEIREKVRALADKDIPILITGESGTGKELVARSIHYYSDRNQGPLVKVNCGALPDDLLESEMFGFQKGAFTGAHKNKPGRFEMADGGTLFIDEIGDLSLPLQVKFLQVLEDKTLSRLGGTHEKEIDTRVVAATNSDLWKKVREGTFRKDLFYRLNVMHLKAPPLRDRPDDVLILADYFLCKYSFELKKELMDMSEAVAQHLLVYHWPGNVRELENVVRRAIVLRSWEFVLNELQPEEGRQAPESTFLPGESEYRYSLTKAADLERLLGECEFALKKVRKIYVSQVEERAILDTLSETNWNRFKAAKLLGVSYKTLLNRIEELQLKP